MWWRFSSSWGFFYLTLYVSCYLLLIKRSASVAAAAVWQQVFLITLTQIFSNHIIINSDISYISKESFLLLPSRRVRSFLSRFSSAPLILPELQQLQVLTWNKRQRLSDSWVIFKQIRTLSYDKHVFRKFDDITSDRHSRPSKLRNKENKHGSTSRQDEMKSRHHEQIVFVLL